MLVVMLGLPALMTFEIFKFASEPRFSDSLVWVEAGVIRYPNLTLCHGKYFDLDRMKGGVVDCTIQTFFPTLSLSTIAYVSKYNLLLADFGISEDLANYMTMIFDQTLYRLVEYRERRFGNERKKLEEKDAELEAVLAEQGADLPGLMGSIAVRCDEFITFCEVHRVFYSGSECCRALFEERPFFGPSGTCFHLRREIYEGSPLVHSTVTVWAEVNETASPGE